MDKAKRISYGSVSLVRQGEHRFYSLTMPTDVLAKTTYVVSRDEDPILGFQRRLDKNRAQEIATYIDNGLGTIPSSIVLSAQEDTNLEYDSTKKTISFETIPHAFLIIDGQHRVYGFRLAKTALRVPVIIYDGLNKQQESQIFIDINSKQRGVPPELLLDIKKLAAYESTEEERLRELFDSFHNMPNSALAGFLSPASKNQGKITRVTFNSAVKPLLKVFLEKTTVEIFDILNNYLVAFNSAVFKKIKLQDGYTNPTRFRAICAFFPDVAARTKDRFGAVYSSDNFYTILDGYADRIKAPKIVSPGSSYIALAVHLRDAFHSRFVV